MAPLELPDGIHTMDGVPLSPRSLPAVALPRLLPARGEQQHEGEREVRERCKLCNAPPSPPRLEHPRLVHDAVEDLLEQPRSQRLRSKRASRDEPPEMGFGLRQRPFSAGVAAFLF